MSFRWKMVGLGLALFAIRLVTAVTADAVSLSTKLRFFLQEGDGVIGGGAEGRGDVTEGSTEVTSVVTFRKAFVVGQVIAGLGIPSGTTIKAVGADTLTLSNPATTTATGVTLTVLEGAGNVATNEKQLVRIEGGPTGGTFTLSFQSPRPGASTATSAPIADNATATEVQGALEGVANVGAGNVSVAGSVGGPYTVEFTGRYADTNVNALSGSGSGLTPSGSVAVLTLQEGALAIETCSNFEACIPGQRGSLPGAYTFPKSVALTTKEEHTKGDVYVADENDNRIQELGPNGEFVRMFGWNVNKTKVKEGAPQSERNVCSAAEVGGGAECLAGEAGTGLPGQLSEAQDVAVDPVTHDVLVYEVGYSRVEEFSETGEFKLMIGREVNSHGVSEEERNLCTKAESANCRKGRPSDPKSVEHGAFKPTQVYGNLLAACANKLYVADEARVQEFSIASGGFAGELELGASRGFPAEGVVTGLALDGSCNVYVTEAHGLDGRNAEAPAGVYEFSPGGALIRHLDASSTMVETIALDQFGRMAVIEGPLREPHGAFFELATGQLLSEFAPPDGMGQNMTDLAFNGEGELYGADNFHQDVELYRPVPIAEVITESAPPCTAHPSYRLPVELKLVGSIDPKSIAQTEGWFAYGLGKEELNGTTPRQSFATVTEALALQATLTGLVPNTVYYYRGEANDANGSSFGETLSCKTRAVPPQIKCCPSAHTSTSTFASVVLEGEIDPNNAGTQYLFEYAEAKPCEELEQKRAEEGASEPHVDLSECPRLVDSAVRESAANESVLDQQTIAELQPSTTYRFRFVGSNAFVYAGEQEGGEAKSVESTFTTGQAPVPIAVTLPASNEAVTSATLAGVVNPDGFAATYSFELGVYNGPATEYGTVVSAPAGSGRAEVEERYEATGLQPGTVYAYRITARDGYATVLAEPRLFATKGLPTALSLPTVLAQLPTPPTRFPQPPREGKGGKLTRAQQLARALKACKKRPRRQRAACVRQAHRKYGTTARGRAHRAGQRGRAG